MKNKPHTSFLIILAALLIMGCVKENKEQLPVEFTWDRDACQECGMIISDHAYASQVIDPSGKGHVFDDIGCAMNWLKDKPWQKDARIWVSDVKTERWIEAKTANWSFGNPNTPMGYGFTATASPLGNPMTFDEVRRRIETGETLHGHHGNHADHGGAGHDAPKEHQTSSNVPQWNANASN